MTGAVVAVEVAAVVTAPVESVVVTLVVAAVVAAAVVAAVVAAAVVAAAVVWELPEPEQPVSTSPSIMSIATVRQRILRVMWSSSLFYLYQRVGRQYRKNAGTKSRAFFAVFLNNCPGRGGAS